MVQSLFVFVAIFYCVIEITVFVQMGQWLGLWPVLGMTVLGGIVGGFILRTQGIRVLQRFASDLGQGRACALESVCLMAAGLLLMSPGFVSDSLALVLVLPPIRKRLPGLVFSWAKRSAWGTSLSPSARTPDSGIIDGEWQEVKRPQDQDSAGTSDCRSRPIHAKGVRKGIVSLFISKL